jgi:sugar lactone lactonase YvrE
MRKIGRPLFLTAVGVLLAATVALAAGGTPSLGWSPTTSAGTYDYGPVTVGGVAQTFTLQNSGTKSSGSLAITLSGSAAFVETTDTCSGIALGANKVCNVTIKYAATILGVSDQATLTASSNKIAMASLTVRGTTRPATPSLSTTAVPAAGPIGTPLQDTANLSGGFSPTGSIVFALYQTPDCSGPALYQEKVPVNGNGSYKTTSGYMAAASSLYQWTAVYGGDANNTPTANTCGSEPVVIAKTTPALTTSAQPASGPIGTVLQATASLTNGSAPTGSILFSLYPTPDCSGPPVSQEPVPVNGNGSYSTKLGYQANLPGPYQWMATYSSDANNQVVATPCGQAPVAVTSLASPSLSTSAQPGSGPVGVTLHDTATLSGGSSPTGSIVFTLYSSLNCSGAFVFQQKVPVNGNGSYATQPGYPAPTAGNYQWIASYSGDLNNNPASTSCGDEPVTVNGVSITTTPMPPLAQVGAQLSDNATISGGLNPGGTIVFHLYPRGDCSGTPVFTGKAPVSGDGTYSPNNGSYQVPAPGTYQWTADYTGDSANNAAGSPCGAEPVTVTPAQTMLSTTPMPPSAPAGTPLQDRADLLGGFSPGGSITFILYATANCSGPAVDQEQVAVGGNGTYVTPVGYGSSGAGNYQWTVTYSGDANNLPATSPCGSEPVSVNPAFPTLSTTPQPVSGPVGTQLQDTAALANGFAPTGHITFSLYQGSDCSSSPVATEDVPVNGNGVYSTTTGYAANAGGTYQWTAHYNGDGSNAPSDSLCGQETVTIASLASPSLSTLGNPQSGPVGTALHDAATLAGGSSPTGSIVFTLYPTADCSGPSAFQTTVAVNGNGSYTSQPGYTASSAGGYQWTAAYSGDGANNPAKTTCGDDPVTVTGVSISTTPVPPSAQVGAQLNDSATLSGGNNPTGSIIFHLYPRPDCSGTPIFNTKAPQVNGDGTYSGQNTYTVPAPGTYQWTATYNGDGANNAVSSPCGAEPVTVTTAQTSLSTTPKPANGPSGSLLQDTVQLSGGYSPSGTITFSLYFGASCSGTPVDTETVGVGGNGTYSTPVGYKPAAAGVYEWVAFYSGDGNNTPASGNCGDEQVTISQSAPTLTTTPNPSRTVIGTVLQDTATLANGFAPTGQITFTLYQGPDCSGSPVATEKVTVNGNGAYGTANGFQAIAPGTYQWTASYSGDANNSPVGSPCGEEQVTVTSVGTPTLTTTPSPTSTQVGGTLQDNATLSGGSAPTGSITFTLYPTSDCSGPFAYQQKVAVTGNGSYGTSTGYATANGGTYEWTASYSGDGNNTPATSSCGQEPVSVIGVNISTTPQPASGQVGGRLNDSATLSGGNNPTGSIIFHLYPRPDCSGTPIFNTKAPQVNGDGTYSGQNTYTVPAPGTYQWTATYNGDGANKSVSSPCGSEPVTVTTAQTSLSTSPKPANGPSGSLLEDTASLSGGYLPSGSITFSLYSTSDCSGTPLDREAVQVSSNGSYTTPVGYIAKAPGVYQWTTTYTGDGNNAPAAGSCGSEPVTIGLAATTLATTPKPASGPVGTVLQDSATLSGGFTPTGSITFTLYQTSDCSGQPVAQETVPVNGNGGYSTSTGYQASSAGTYQWTARYGGDGGNAPVTTPCGQEPVTVTAIAVTRHVYWTNNNLNTIGRSEIDGSNVNTNFITGSVKKPRGIAVDGNFVYWVNSANNAIGRANLDGTSPNVSFISGFSQPVGVAVDAKFIYWTWNNGGQGAIGRANLDGTGVLPVFMSAPGSPQGIAVDGSHIYWADINGQTIGRANLDGSSPNPSFISSTFALGPAGVAVNATSIYWTNTKNNTIGRANLDGSSPVASFIVNGVSGPQSIAADSKFVYWANGGTNAVIRTNLDGSGGLSIQAGTVPFGVAVDAG